ncbi:IclR family transcriptional regulator [Thermodesulfobacteriota bacterium]
MDKKDPKNKYIVPAVEQAIRVLLCLAGSKSSHMSLTEICEQVGIHKSKAFGILHTLQRFGLVQSRGRKKGYSLGTGLITLSRKVLDGINVIAFADPMLRDLSDKVKGTAALGIIDGDTVVVVSRYESIKNVGVTIRVGNHVPISYGAHGKAIAAFMPEGDLDALLQKEKLHFHGKPENFDKDRLMMELEQCRKTGYATDIGEITPGLNAASAPVIDINGKPIGYLLVIGLFTPEATRKHGTLVAEAGRDLSRQLGANLDNL